MQTKIILLLLSFAWIITIQAQTLEPTEDMALLNVLVTNKQKQPLEGEIVSFTGIKNKQTYTNHTDKEGKFSILIPAGDTYKVDYRNFTEEVDYDKFEIPGDKKIYTLNYHILFEPGKVFVLENVEYDFNKATLRPSSYKTLNDLVEVMKIKNNMIIEIAGHTDNKGTDEHNNKLSQERAESVRNYLISKGIGKDRVLAKGYGASQPIAQNQNSDGSDNPEGRQKNRRTEVKVIQPQ